jgi:hypothetical protein
VPGGQNALLAMHWAKCNALGKMHCLQCIGHNALLAMHWAKCTACKYLQIEFQINKLQKSVMLTQIAPSF